MVVKRQYLELDKEQLIGLKLVKGNNKAEYCHIVYLTYLQIHHMKCQTR